jgi:hypothetical protein
MYIESVVRYLQKSSGLEKRIEEEVNAEVLPKIIDKCRENARKHLFYFMKRFGCWKELQISAALGGETWDTFAHFRVLREFALSHDFINEGKLFIERTNKIKPVNLYDERGMESLHDNTSTDNMDNMSINKWLNTHNVLTHEKLLELSRPMNQFNKEKSFNEYQTSLLVVSNVEDVRKQVEFPAELLEAYKNNTNIVNKEKDDIPLTKVRKLYNSVRDANEINDKLYELYVRDMLQLEDMSDASELNKYIPFLKYRRDEKMYEITGSRKYDTNLEAALKKARAEYPEYEANKFNWKSCS